MSSEDLQASPETAGKILAGHGGCACAHVTVCVFMRAPLNSWVGPRSVVSNSSSYSLSNAVVLAESPF